MATPPSDFTEAYGRFWAPVRAKCRRILGRSALADEIAQEAFVRLWQTGPRLEGAPRGLEQTRTIMAWLYVTSTRLAIDALRDGRVVPFDESAAEPMPCGGSLVARSAIRALVRQVPPEEIEAALLARIDGLPQPEVAEVLGVSERTVRRLLERFDERSARLREEVNQ